MTLSSRPKRSWGIVATALLIAVLFMPKSASAFWNHDWSYRKQITLNLSAAGLSAKSDLGTAPMLIRLHEGVFKFTDANSDGSDLRFVADDDKTPLKFHIEKYDSVFNLAFIWVSVPVHAGEKTSIWMYYGNSHATNGSEPRETYDAEQVLVYHFAERGTPVLDSTGYANTSPSSAAPDEGGLIGLGAKFEGQRAVTIPGASSLQLAAGGAQTIAFWVKPSVAGADATLYSRREGSRGLEIALSKGAPVVRVFNDAGNREESPQALPLGEKAWHQIAVTLGAQIQLYVDGAPIAALQAPSPALNTPASFGGDSSTPVGNGFVGQIDELEISRVARDPAYLALLASNQGTAGKLVEFGADQQLSSWSSGYFAIILRSVTLDGWVVIGILAVMAALSWFVMVTKTRQIGRAAQGNREFMQLFRKQGGDFNALLHTMGGAKTQDLTEPQRLHIQNAPLYRMFTAGMTEIRSRVQAESPNGTVGNGGSLTAESIEAVRASVDASLVDELDAFDDRMVVLTIAISGGPFLGLLGTVVGVMITFAAIAASGDVNINSIAPGIAAALVATVAGLVVAIPSLFGYNYLTTRIRRLTAQMQVFIDTLITRATEHYNPVRRSPAGASYPAHRAEPRIAD